MYRLLFESSSSIALTTINNISNKTSSTPTTPTMQFAAIIAAALLGAVPAFAGQRAWCVGGANPADVTKGCSDNGIKLQGDAGTCCATTAEEYRKMANICFYIGAKPAFDGDC
ncbi:hypothetical protein CB0940_00344 [Cercospora beticola]|uniref:Uncharacterized protein n=1 Tax=Cercospora beticola TaxID=122368 RepID=A0A2G5IAK2_CERBT|nr:hypothetical protein CB0940_00344 [Cercospora beticola]PIB01574.1 hypothetical protein CB0940_00344 [Cercospora beticola]WPA95755.1 hypothetical protein RHO25_000358 [Cercospora beticola]CAK1355995.1 unnamed protein product [Cercospora beticola]